jgi:hypothetical protein
VGARGVIISTLDGGGGIEESPKPQASSSKPAATIVRGVLLLPRDMTELPGNSARVPRPALLDVAGRKVMELWSGPNDVSGFPPGVYFVRERSAASGEPSAVFIRKVVITR